jgi:hypothetical protein
MSRSTATLLVGGGRRKSRPAIRLARVTPVLLARLPNLYRNGALKAATSFLTAGFSKQTPIVVTAVSQDFLERCSRWNLRGGHLDRLTRPRSVTITHAKQSWFGSDGGLLASGRVRAGRRLSLASTRRDETTRHLVLGQPPCRCRAACQAAHPQGSAALGDSRVSSDPY